MAGDRLVSDAENAENVSEAKVVADVVADAVTDAVAVAKGVSEVEVGCASPTLSSTSKGTSRKLPKRIFSLANFFRIVVVVDERLEVEADPDNGPDIANERDVASEPNR